jgi:hypothetical protein
MEIGMEAVADPMEEQGMKPWVGQDDLYGSAPTPGRGVAVSCSSEIRGNFMEELAHGHSFVGLNLSA